MRQKAFMCIIFVRLKRSLLSIQEMTRKNRV